MTEIVCAHCWQVAGNVQGHFGAPLPGSPICPNTKPSYYANGPVGFCCPPGHVCHAEAPDREHAIDILAGKED